MFVGHYAASLALKATDRRVPTLPLFLGVQVLDIASAALVLAGIEHWRVVPGITAASPLELDVPYTHGFLTSLSWAVLCAAAVIDGRRDLGGGRVLRNRARRRLAGPISYRGQPRK